jgi:hypothetical protein
MANLMGFDASQVEPNTFDPIPAGKYLAMIVDSQMKTNRAGTGKYLELTFIIIEGQYQGRRLWARLSLEHANEQAVKIARARLSAICRAVGVLTPRDSVELHNLPLMIRVACERRKDTDEIINVIKAYDRPVSVTAQPQHVNNDTPPWQR